MVAYEEVLDSALGALLGAAIGDALGAPVEFMSPQEIESRHGVLKKMVGGGWLYLKPGQVTDDTEMSLCIARAMDASGGFDLTAIAENFASWMKRGPVDVGSTVAQGIRNYMHKNLLEMKRSQWHAGNGAVMRMSPIAVASYGCVEKLSAWSVAQAHLTHNHELSDAACIAVGKMVHSGMNGELMRGPREAVEELIAQHSEFRFVPYDGKASGYVVETMCTVFHHFFITDTFDECLIGVVNAGGDADTNGCIAGLVAGAFYGARKLPKKWLKKLDPRVRKELTALAPRLLAMSPAMREGRLVA